MVKKANFGFKIFEKTIMKKIVVLLTILLAQTVFAQKLIAYRDSVPNGYNFWLYVPESYDPHKADMPVVISLHGLSLQGTDLNQVLRYGVITGLKHGKDYNALVVAPQTPTNWNPEKLDRVRQWVLDRYPSDTNRVYMVGISMGSSGTTDYIGTYPDKIAAAMSLCGSTHLKNFENLNKVPFWIIHGTADERINISSSKYIVNRMEKAGPTDRLLTTWLKGYDHGKLARFFYIPMTFNWLFSHSLADKDRPVNRDYEVNTRDLATAYSGGDKTLWKRVQILDPRKDKKVQIINPKDDPSYNDPQPSEPEQPSEHSEQEAPLPR